MGGLIKMFWQKWKNEPEALQEGVFQRLDKLESSVRALKIEVLDLLQAQEALRERIYKRLKPLKEYEKEEEKKDLYNGMLLKE